MVPADGLCREMLTQFTSTRPPAQREGACRGPDHLAGKPKDGLPVCDKPWSDADRQCPIEMRSFREAGDRIPWDLSTGQDVRGRLEASVAN